MIGPVIWDTISPATSITAPIELFQKLATAASTCHAGFLVNAV